jgi:excisionase family DNA binding protein
MQQHSEEKMESNTAERKLYNRMEAAQLLSISLRKIDDLMATKQLASVRIGKRRLISAEAVQKFIRKMELATR